MQMETVGFWLILAGVGLVAFAYLWLVVVAFRTRVAWGVALLLFPLWRSC